MPRKVIFERDAAKHHRELREHPEYAQPWGGIFSKEKRMADPRKDWRQMSDQQIHETAVKVNEEWTIAKFKEWFANNQYAQDMVTLHNRKEILLFAVNEENNPFYSGNFIWIYPDGKFDAGFYDHAGPEARWITDAIFKVKFSKKFDTQEQALERLRLAAGADFGVYTEQGVINGDREPWKSFPNSVCAECRDNAKRGGPHHNGSPSCKSSGVAARDGRGFRQHCSCDTCY